MESRRTRLEISGCSAQAVHPTGRTDAPIAMDSLPRAPRPSASTLLNRRWKPTLPAAPSTLCLCLFARARAPQDAATRVRPRCTKFHCEAEPPCPWTLFCLPTQDRVASHTAAPLRPLDGQCFHKDERSDASRLFRRRGEARRRGLTPRDSASRCQYRLQRREARRLSVPRPESESASP